MRIWVDGKEVSFWLDGNNKAWLTMPPLRKATRLDKVKLWFWRLLNP
jgi:hypothetical protein